MALLAKPQRDEKLSGQREQKVVVNGISSERERVISGTPQGSVLGPILFIIHVKTIPQTVKSSVYLFAVEAKIYRSIHSNHPMKAPQNDLTNITE